MHSGWLVHERGSETIRDLAERLGVQVVTHPTAGGGRIPEHRFYASIPRVEIMDRRMLRSVAGYGITRQAALDDLAEKLSYERIAVDAYTPNRREVALDKIAPVNIDDEEVRGG